MPLARPFYERHAKATLALLDQWVDAVWNAVLDKAESPASYEAMAKQCLNATPVIDDYQSHDAMLAGDAVNAACVHYDALQLCAAATRQPGR